MNDAPTIRNADSCRAIIRSYVVENLLLGAAQDLDDDKPLYDSGILDSVSVMELVAFIEATFDVRVLDPDLTEDNFGSISRAVRFVEKRKPYPCLEEMHERAVSNAAR
jgi:acyl carrier protein